MTLATDPAPPKEEKKEEKKDEKPKEEPKKDDKPKDGEKKDDKPKEETKKEEKKDDKKDQPNKDTVLKVKDDENKYGGEQGIFGGDDNQDYARGDPYYDEDFNSLEECDVDYAAEE